MALLLWLLLLLLLLELFLELTLVNRKLLAALRPLEFDHDVTASAEKMNGAIRWRRGIGILELANQAIRCRVVILLTLSVLVSGGIGSVGRMIRGVKGGARRGSRDLGGERASLE